VRKGALELSYSKGGILMSSVKLDNNYTLKPITHKNIIDETGSKYSRLKVIGYVGSHNPKQLAMWKCVCDCGNITYARGSELRYGGRISCGCMRVDSLRKEPGEAAFNQLYHSYRHDAKKRGLDFKLNKEEFKNLTSGICHYCGDIPSKKSTTPSNNGFYIYNGIDRMDNSKGYLLDNCLSCCTICNRAKSDMEYNDFVNWLKRINNIELI